MELTEEKKNFKPYNIYDPKGPEARAQGKMNSAVGETFNAAANFADTYAGGAGARKVGRGVSMVTPPIVMRH